MTVIVSKAELARYLSVSKSRITVLCKRGMPTRPDGKIILEDAVEWMRSNCEQNASFPDKGVNFAIGLPFVPSVNVHGRSADDLDAPVDGADRLDDDSVVLEYQVARALHETFKARMARLEYERALGLVVGVGDVEVCLAKIFCVIRNLFLGLPSKCTPVLVGLSAPQIFEVLTVEVRQILTNLSETEFLADTKRRSNGKRV